jgi:hypothetical protein
MHTQSASQSLLLFFSISECRVSLAFSDSSRDLPIIPPSPLGGSSASQLTETPGRPGLRNLKEVNRAIRLLRADSGFFDDKLLSFLEQRLLPYIVVVRLTPWVKRAADSISANRPSVISDVCTGTPMPNTGVLGEQTLRDLSGFYRCADGLPCASKCSDLVNSPLSSRARRSLPRRSENGTGDDCRKQSPAGHVRGVMMVFTHS